MSIQTADPTLPSRHKSKYIVLALGGIVVGTLDLVFATLFWSTRGVPPIRILQSIAAGLLGSASFERGTNSASLGVGLHYLIATMFIVIYYFLSQRLNILFKRPIACGLLYGIFLYVVMNFVVVPLSDAESVHVNDTAWVTSSILVHTMIGVICALFAGKVHALQKRIIP